MVVPEKAVGEKKRVVYGVKSKNKKEKSTLLAAGKCSKNWCCMCTLGCVEEVEDKDDNELCLTEVETKLEEDCLESWEDLDSWDTGDSDEVHMHGQVLVRKFECSCVV